MRLRRLGGRGGAAESPPSPLIDSLGAHATPTQRAAGTARILVASDVVTRGMDFEGGVSVVINYDAPVYAKTYVHRCAWTAGTPV